MNNNLWGLIFLLLMNSLGIPMVAEPTQVIEYRGVWVDKSDVYKGKEYLTQMFDKITSANLNAVHLPVQHKGYVIYPNSKYLPQDPEVLKKDEEILKWMIDEVRKRKLQVVAWPEYGFYAYHTLDITTDKSRGAFLDKYPELTAIDINGKPYLQNRWGYFYSLCSSNPQSHEIMINLLTEIITLYPFDGLDLDRIRYPTKDFCFCPYCKENFKKDTGFELDQQEIEKERVKKAFYAWRKQQLNKFMEKLTTKVRELRPNILITAYVWSPDEIDGKGQDWPTWVQKGYLDLVTPSMYMGDMTGIIEESLKLIPSPGLMMCGLSAEDKSSEELAMQIELARKKQTRGVMLWYLGKVIDDLDYLGKTVFKSPAQPVTKQNLKSLQSQCEVKKE